MVFLGPFRNFRRLGLGHSGLVIHGIISSLVIFLSNKQRDAETVTTTTSLSEKKMSSSFHAHSNKLDEQIIGWTKVKTNTGQLGENLKVIGIKHFIFRPSKISMR